MMPVKDPRLCVIGGYGDGQCGSEGLIIGGTLGFWDPRQNALLQKAKCMLTGPVAFYNLEFP